MFGRKKSVRTGAGTDTDAASTSVPEATGSTTDGPHDRNSIPDIGSYYSGIEYGRIDLGAVVIGIPKGRELNVALDPNGQPEFHVLTEASRVIPRVFAAPKSAGQWRSMVTDMRDQLEKQGAEVSIVDGPWGRELVAEMPGAVFRAIGVDGHRWTAEVRIMARPENVDQAAEEGRDVLRHLLVHRGDGPMPAREQLPLTIPDEIQQAIEKTRAQLAAQQQAQAYQQQMSARGGAGSPQAAQPQSQAAQAQPRQQPNQAPAPASPTGPKPAEAPTRRDGSAMDRLRGTDDI